jgi:hypothetical protein
MSKTYVLFAYDVGDLEQPTIASHAFSGRWPLYPKLAESQNRPIPTNKPERRNPRATKELKGDEAIKTVAGHRSPCIRG